MTQAQIQHLVSREVSAGIAKECHGQSVADILTTLTRVGIIGDPNTKTAHAILIKTVSEDSFWARAGHDPVAIFTLVLVIATLLLVAIPLFQDWRRHREYATAVGVKVASILSIFHAGLRSFEQNPRNNVEAITGNWDMTVAELFSTDIAQALEPTTLRRVYLLCAKLNTALRNIRTAQAEESLDRVVNSARNVRCDVETVISHLPSGIVSKLREQE